MPFIPLNEMEPSKPDKDLFIPTALGKRWGTARE